MGNFNKYGLCTIRSIELNLKFHNAVESWEKAATAIFESESSRSKSCPKNTFLGLCNEGLIEGISKGKYTGSKLNKAYGLKAVEILRKNHPTIFSAKELWEKLDLGDKRHNSQMHVVLALWQNDLIVGSKK